MGWFYCCRLFDKGICLLQITKANVPQCHQIIAMSPVSRRMILTENQELRKRYRKVFNLDLILQMLLTIINQPIEAGACLLHFAELLISQLLIEDHIRRLVIIIHCTRRLIRSHRSFLVTLLCFLCSAQALFLPFPAGQSYTVP